jgi:lambda family phage portal protein
MNILDRIIAPFAPRWAVNRMAARCQMALFERALEAGPSSRTSGRRPPSRSGPNVKAGEDLDVTRAQARDLYRRNPYARGTVNSIVANLVGTGIKPRPSVMDSQGNLDEKFNDAAEESWKRWAESCDITGRKSFYDCQRMVQKELFVAGECLVSLGYATDGRKVPLVVEVIPSERLADKQDLQPKTGGKTIQGVEFDSAGRLANYWLFPNHPGEAMFSSAPKPYPASQILHIYEELEPGQVRGLTRFLTTAEWFEGLAQYLDYELIGSRVRSAFAVMILRAGGLFKLPSTGDAADEKDDAGNDIDYLEGGMVFHGKSGDDIKSAAPAIANTAFEPFVKLMLSGIARGMDVSYELVSRDLSQVTYLSARQGENQDRRHWEPQQESLNRALNQPVWRRFITDSMLAKQVPRRGERTDFTSVDFIRPGWDWIDPGKDVAADILACQAGFMSPLEAIRRKGRDPKKVLQEMAQFKTWADELGLKPAIFESTKPAPPMAPEDPSADPEANPPEDASAPAEDQATGDNANAKKTKTAA